METIWVHEISWFELHSTFDVVNVPVADFAELLRALEAFSAFRAKKCFAVLAGNCGEASRWLDLVLAD